MQNISEHPSKMLLQKRTSLISSLLKRKSSTFLKMHAGILDDYFHQSFQGSIVNSQISIDKNPYAIIALGGYGRKEQCVHSDIDLLFLFKKSISDKVEDLIQEIVYPLWDIGLEVGYATRSMEECVSFADKNFYVLTPLLDARFICGSPSIYSELMEQLREKIIYRQSKKIISWLIESNRERHSHFGDSTYLLQPNLKEGQGGLRDYHTMLWIGRIDFNLKQFRDLEYYGRLAHAEFQALIKALSFIWHVRNCLHQMAGRKCDQLHFEYQTELVKTLKFKRIKRQEPVETFLGELHARMEFIKQQHLMFLEQGYLKKPKRKSKRLKYKKDEGLKVKKGMLRFHSLESVLDSPKLIIKIFEESARLNIPLSAEAKRIVNEFGNLVDDKFRTSTYVVKSFERILSAPVQTFNVLKEMLSTGFLERFIPEIKGIINRIQYDEYHLYPVDMHLLRTVQTIKNFAEAENNTYDPLYRNLYNELKHRKLLLWAAFLHDIGKGDPGKSHSERGAKIAKTLLSAKGLKPKEIETISFLIKEHLLLVKIATRRDIHDEETAIFCARKIKDVERLKMLYLLTIADSMATGPKAWNDWISTLLRDLFLKVLSILEKGELATREAVEIVEKKREEVIRSTHLPHRRESLESLFNVMSPRYLLFTPANELLKDIKLYNSLENKEFVWNITKASDRNTRTVKICAKDRPGLFSKIAGTFTLNNIDILDAQIFTWRNNIALDIFEVKPPLDKLFEDERWEKVEKNLKSALLGRLDLASELCAKMSAYRSIKPKTLKMPNRIVVDNTTSSFFTIVEVFTYDFPGLLFSITDALFRCKLDIWIAKISTKIDQVVDVFYVRDFDGQKVDSPEQEEAINIAIKEILPKIS